MRIYASILAAALAATTLVASSVQAETPDQQRMARLDQSQPAYRQAASAAPQYLLGTGDKVRVTVYGEDDLSGEYAVDGNGMIAMPLIGDVRASGLSAPQLQAAVENAYGNGYLNNPRVAVEVTTYRPFTVIGQVTRPGQYPYASGMTADNAVALAGGFTSQAEEGYVYVRHEGQTKEVKLAADGTTQIQPGDVIRVEPSVFWNLMSVATPLTAILGTARYGLP